MSKIKAIIQKGTYQDSVVLMQLSKRLMALEGVTQAVAVMGTPQNKSVLKDAGLLIPEAATAQSNDLVVIVTSEEDQPLDAALALARDALSGNRLSSGPSVVDPTPGIRTIGEAMSTITDANLALISTPGPYAAAEGYKALKAGLNVMLFSSSVTVEDEVALKTLARRRGLLVMGPDCGTAILSGVPLGFANVVPRGDVGIVAAAGTGLQELTCQLSRESIGISHAIGAGSRDLWREIGGITTLQGYEALLRDDRTKLIVLLSKPPHPETAMEIVARCERGPKPVVICFLGMDPQRVSLDARYSVVRSIEQAVMAVSDMIDHRVPAVKGALLPELVVAAREEKALVSSSQRYIRGLFSGGTLCTEAMIVLSDLGRSIYSNAPLAPAQSISALGTDQADVLLDLGAEEYTVARPHPMIDYRTRIAQLLDAANDPSVGVLLMDVVLGYGAHRDPASEIVPVIQAARQRAAEAGRHLVVVTTVCGTSQDPQDLQRQEEALRGAGVLLAPGTAQAARMAHAVTS